jgi:hypothetical protein
MDTSRHGRVRATSSMVSFHSRLCPGQLTAEMSRCPEVGGLGRRDEVVTDRLQACALPPSVACKLDHQGGCPSCKTAATLSAYRMRALGRENRMNSNSAANAVSLMPARISSADTTSPCSVARHPAVAERCSRVDGEETHRQKSPGACTGSRRSRSEIRQRTAGVDGDVRGDDDQTKA